ncbi:ribosomal RNA large subunit methyltransferase F [Striga asiatica]|uniref:U6 small nuclear RNA (adenine-(43)-N(6))-methyltransferase n=1 Tax=Striga asiatica TaxID=4170 RepID=A0A5A7QYZ5_STRAF|nr:ribosomal RNA large subunit methyltransferase F [Striga asiatica]
MAGKRKRKNANRRPGIHPRNKYADNTPDFGLLASSYPSFEPYVFYSHDGRPKIDWTDFNATRELTRVLLLHDHGINWWIPDGQLCPTVPNRSNYIHWIEDLLASDIIAVSRSDDDVIKGFDIGTGANCIYPLLGASVLGWKFVGSDITDVAVEWANRNVESNPHISDLIEIRRVGTEDITSQVEELQNGGSFISGLRSYNGPPVLLGVVKDGEIFDFCMCNPPFFETMEEAGLNPKTSCGGTPEEMVCFGGELAFITRIIEDSVKLKNTFRWYTSMVGRKYNLSILVSELWNVGATVVKTTEFVQGRTSRWGLAWSFLSVARKITLTPSNNKIDRNNLSFMLEGLQRHHSAFHVLQSVESHFASGGILCKLDAASFNVDVTATKEQIDAVLKSETCDSSRFAVYQHETNESSCSSDFRGKPDAICFRISVFQQNPGALLVRGTLHEKTSSIPGLFQLIFQHLEEFLTRTFRTRKTR